MGFNSAFKGLTSALHGGRRSTPRPSRINPRKENRYLLYSGQFGPQGRSVIVFINIILMSNSKGEDFLCVC